MDALDCRLLDILEHDPRTTYSEIGEQLNVSTPTAQRRVENLLRTGRIRFIRYRLDVEALGGRRAIVLGSVRVKMVPEVIDGLQDQGSIFRFIQCVNNFVAMFIDVREKEDVEGALSFLKERLGLEAPLVLHLSPHGFMITRTRSSKENAVIGDLSMLTPTDLKIVRRLYMDGREPIASIANETGVSARTVKRRIELLVKSCLIDQEIDYNLRSSEDIWFGIFLRVRDPSMKGKLFKQLERLDKEKVHLFISGVAFENAPDMITMDGTTRTLSDLDDAMNEIANMDGVLEVNHSIVQMTRILDTWVHRMTRGELPLPAIPSKR